MPTFKNILIVEDDIITSLVCERVMLLADFSNNVTKCTSVADAIKVMENTGGKIHYMPDIIFLDLHLGPQDGWDFLEWYSKWAKPSYKFPPIYILSSSLDEDDMRRSAEFSHVKGFIVKPVKVEDLNTVKIDVLQMRVVS